MKLTALIFMAASCIAMAATEEQINKKFDVQPDGKLIIEVDFGSIVVTNCEGNQVVIDAWRKITRKNKDAEDAYLKETPVVITKDGNTITIRSHSDKKFRFNLFSGNREEGRYIVGVPANFNTGLSTAGGSIKIVGITGSNHANTSGGSLSFERLKGNLNGNTSGGAIRMADCEGALKIGTSGGGIDVTGGSGALDGATSGGSVQVKNFKGPARVSTSGGGISVENVAGQVNANTSGGSINATLVSPVPDEVHLSTSGGGITIRAAGDAAFNIDAGTSGGGVSCDLPIVIEGKKESNNLRGAINGGGKKVSAHTSGGSIHVKKL